MAAAQRCRGRPQYDHRRNLLRARRSRTRGGRSPDGSLEAQAGAIVRQRRTSESQFSSAFPPFTESIVFQKRTVSYYESLPLNSPSAFQATHPGFENAVFILSPSHCDSLLTDLASSRLTIMTRSLAPTTTPLLSLVTNALSKTAWQVWAP